ncbi:endonuclease/exonuclease/phosphatase family protein [Ornithinimicrobium sp. Y1847]|uniref:endonuclease/exonuclease/phosphatase family protein n=1 Tax=Ornithinimicrobium sp. Y1847 TaxID=3405419 RepID=UPI003B67F5D5
MRVATGVLAGWWVVACVLTLARWLDLPGPLPLLQAGLVPVGLSLVPLLLCTVVLRRWLLVLSVLALGMVHLAIAIPWWIDQGIDESEDDLIVAAINLEYGRGSMDDVEALVQRHHVDVLVLIEATPATARALESSTLADDLPHRSGEVSPDASGTLVLTRAPHEARESPPGFVFGQEIVDLGSDVTVVAAHTFPPVGSSTQVWREELRTLGRGIEDEPTRGLVVLGDLNASTGHPALRELMTEQRLEAAHRVAGQGWVRTWPRNSQIPPFVQIDHVLVRGLDVVDAGTWPVADTDHLAVWARLAAP